jgi:hypothetical protein
MTSKKSSANLEVAIATQDVTTDGAKVEKSAKTTTYEQLAKCHETLPRTEQGEVIIDCKQLHDLAASHKYLHKCECSGKKNRIHITEKVSNYGSGAYTVLTGTVNGERFELLTISELKKLIGCEYVRPTASKLFVSRATRTLTQLETEARTEGEKELADLIQKAKVFAQAREKAKIEEEKKAREQKEKEQKESRKVERAKDILASLTEEQRNALLKELGL